MRPIDDLREKIDLWRKSTTDTALMSVLHDVLKQIDVAIYEMDHQKAESPWHRVEDDPPDGNEDAVIYYEWTGISGRVYRETSIISLNELIVLGRRPIAWMEKPEPQKEENDEGFVALAIKETERSEE